MKAILFVLILALFVMSGCVTEGVSKATAKCIASKSILYIKTGCPYCEEQEELFGKNFEYLNVVNCAEEPGVCIEAGIDRVGVPTWVIDGEKIVGVQSIEELKELTGC